MTAEALIHQMLVDTIDAYLADTKHQTLLDAKAVRDLLLDLRVMVAAIEP